MRNITEIKAELEKRKRQKANADPEQVKFLEGKIKKLEDELSEAEGEKKEPEKPVEPKKKKAKKKKAKKGKGVRAVIPDKPVKAIDDNDPDCQELLKRHREAARKRIKANKKRKSVPIAKQVVDTVEKATESVEKKTEKMADEDKDLNQDAVKKLSILSDNLVKNIAEVIKTDKLRKDFIKNLIEKLKKLL